MSLDLTQYAQTLTKEPKVLQEHRERINSLTEQNMSVSPETGAFLSFIVSALQCESVFEAGTFYGYSTLWLAFNNPQCTVTTCDISTKYLSVAQQGWEEGQCAKRICFYNENALTLLEKSNQKFDLIFIDAQKSLYKEMTTAALRCLSPKGVVIIDNLFLKGRVLDSSDKSGAAIAAFNCWINTLNTLRCSILPVGDGITLLKKA